MVAILASAGWRFHDLGSMGKGATLNMTQKELCFVLCWYFSIKLDDYRWCYFARFLQRQSRPPLPQELCLGHITAFTQLFLVCSNQSTTSWDKDEPSSKTYTTSSTVLLHSALEAVWQKKNAFSWTTKCLVFSSTYFIYQEVKTH